MIRRIALAVLLSSSLLLAAAPATQSAKPTTEPVVTAKPTTQPAVKKFPTPSELIRKMKQSETEEKQLPKVAYIDLDTQIVERPAGFSLFGDDSAITFQSLMARLKKAREDKAVRAVLITLGKSELNLAQGQEIREELSAIRRAGKRAFVYADAYDTVGYTIASGATDICLLPGGELELPGVGLETMFYKGLFDKIGVQADYVQIGEYKGAQEPYTRIGATDELKGELNKLADAMYDQIVDGISLNRNLPKQTVKQVIDDTLINAQAAKDRGLVDHLVDIDGLRNLLSSELGDKVNLVRDYGKRPKPSVDLSNPFALLATLVRKPEISDKPAIALVSAAGVIMDGEGGDSLLGGSMVGSDDIRKACRIIERDERIKAIVIRIDSPGGSALASEVMWQAVRRVAKTKPVIISIGHMAASGGYYLSSAGDYIFADPGAIIGSIGVVGGKFVMKDLFGKIGLTTEPYLRGRNAGLFSSNAPFSEAQRRMITNWMRQTYDQFTQRVMSTRGRKIKDIDQVARGRIFTAKQGKELGMVDELGGIDSAITFAAKVAKLAPDGYVVRNVPAPKTFADLIAGDDGTDTKTPLAPKVQLAEDSILRALSPSTREMLLQQIQVLQLLQNRPVILVSPVIVNVK